MSSQLMLRSKTLLSRLPQVSSSFVCTRTKTKATITDEQGRELSVDPKDYMTLPDPIETEVGVVRAQWLGRATGNMLVEEKFYLRQEGTYDKPNLVPSHDHEKMVYCYCGGVTDAIERFFILRNGMKRRCECGYWFEMCEAEPGQMDSV